MGWTSCGLNGTVDDSKFNEPMPWIGLYIALASSICALVMALDAFHGFRYRKFWFPCKFFGINATTLTIISVAVKLSVDLNTSMPRRQDQLAKLSSNALLCTAIGNSLPSLGTMETQEMMMNVVALGIVVITVIFNVCIQLGTGVIYLFCLEHIALMFLMVVLFLLLISSALAIPSTKYYLDIKYQQKYVIANEECGAPQCNTTSLTQKLRDDLTKYWMMAHTCNPQFVVGRSATCTASGAFCLLSTMTLAEAIIRSYLTPWCYRFCRGESDYKWSITAVLASQVIAVVIGTIAPASRWFLAIKFRCPKKFSELCVTNVEAYWIKKLRHLKECPLELQISGRHVRRLVHIVKDRVLDSCIRVQKGLVVLSKFVRLISIFIVHKLLVIRYGCKKFADLIRRKNIDNTIRDINMKQEPDKADLSHYVLHLQGEEDLIDLMKEHDCDATSHWIKMGRKKQPKNLITLLEKLNPRREFEGLKKFDSRKVLSLHREEPPNNWSLPVVTLTSIAVAISSDDFNRAQELIRLVSEGIKYIRVVENNLTVKKDLSRIRQTADLVWAGVDLHYKWLDLDLQEISRQGKIPKEVIPQLSDAAKNKFKDVMSNELFAYLMDDPLKWPLKSLAANSMYRICETLLLNEDERSSECNKAMFENIKLMIIDIIGGCLINLKDAILMKCHKSSIEHREEDVRNAIILLGKTEKVLEILGAVRTLPCSDREVLVCINEWRALVAENDISSKGSCGGGDQNTGFRSSSSDLYLNID